MSLLRCINCDIRVTRIRRHLLSNESEALKEVIRLWTYPREITNTDFICHACWELANAQATGANVVPNQERQVGHHNICVGCGRSILQLRSRTILRENPTNEESPIINIISSWIHPRQLTSTDQACTACWLRAQRTLRRQQVADEERVDVENEEVTTCVNCNEELLRGNGHILVNEDENLTNMIKNWIYPNNVNLKDHICHACWQLANEATRQSSESPEPTPHTLQTDYLQQEDNANPSTNPPPPINQGSITLLSVRRAAATPRHCIFPNCSNIERYHVPDIVRSRVVKEFYYYIPRSARICSYHSGANMFDQLYMSTNSYDNFTTEQIEDLIFILTEHINRNDFNFEDVNTIPEHLLHYWIGLTKEEHNQVLCE